MKKFTLAIMMLSFCASLFAQRVEFPSNSNGILPFSVPYTGTTVGLPAVRTNPANSGMNKLSKQSAWYDFTYSFSQAQVNGGFDLKKKYYNLVMFPDTFVKIIYVDQTTAAASPSYSNWCSLGTCFDPTDSIYSLDGDTIDAISRSSTSYTVDSVAYFYTYTRSTDTSVVDTLIFQATKASLYYIQKDAVSGGITSGQGTTLYDNRNNDGKGMSMTLKIPLTKKDTSTYYFKTLQRGLGITCNIGEYVITVVSFKPGNKYSLNDTLADYYGPDTTAHKPAKKFNRFGLWTMYDDNGTQNLSHRPNNGLVVNKQQRYLPTWFYNPKDSPMYMMFSGFGATGNLNFYPRTNYKVTGYTGTGISQMTREGYGLGNIYPNPVNGNATIDFALGKSSTASIEIYDIVGRKVMTAASGMFTSGNHTLKINTEGMVPGIYFYTINADGFTQTKKFTVAQ